MNETEPLQPPKLIGITFSVWRHAPLAWSLYWTGRLLDRRGAWVAALGRRMMDKALEKLPTP